MPTKNEWWRQEDANEIFRGDGNGQEFTSVFCRFENGSIEYAVIRCSDGDYVEHIFGGILLANGSATPIPSD